MKINLEKIKGNLKKWPRKLAERALLTFLILTFLICILGIILFYQYSFLPEKTKPVITEKPLRFKKELYQNILETWAVQQERFEKTQIKLYPNPFQGF